MELKVIGAPDSHDTLLQILESRPPCRVLDAPSGTGVIAQRLLQLGYDVHCADIDPGNLKLADVPFTQANLNRGLNLPNDSFDMVVCANGVHRLFSLGNCLREFARVLRPGGTLLVNVNNYASIDRRLRFLFYGSLDNAVNDAHCNQTIEDPEANVRIALHLPHLLNQLEAAGFEIVSIRPAAVRSVHRLLGPVAMLVRLLSYLVPARSRRRNRLRWTRSRGVLPGGRYFFLEARLPDRALAKAA